MIHSDFRSNCDSLLLSVNDLHTYYFLGRGRIIRAVAGVSFVLKQGEALGIVGESGSGKSTLARSIIRAVDPPGRVMGGEVIFRGRDLLQLSEAEMRRLRGKEISLIFQDPLTALDPMFTIGDQLFETVQAHEKLSKEETRARALEALNMVGISNGEEVFNAYPCEFSAGFRQRIMIALAMICRPYLVIADEPTTTLGATVQAQVLDSLYEIRHKSGAAVIFITHDFGVVSQFTTHIMVMYAGICVEYGPKKRLLLHPHHPYTIGLIRSVPLIEARRGKRLKSIPGFPPNMVNLPPGCPFAPRCEYAQDVCRRQMPPLLEVAENHLCACHFPVAYDTREDLILPENI